MKEDKMMV